MKHALVAALAALLCGCGAAPAPQSSAPAPEKAASSEPPAERTHGRHHHKRHSGGPGTTAMAKADPATKAPGNFDFYVLSLSWAPGFCATPAGQRDPQECGPQRHLAFVLHGLWPQYEQKGWPENCSTETVDDQTVESMLRIMPSPHLVEHEWARHGTCSGLTPKEYFEEATDAYEAVKIPAAYAQLSQNLAVSPEKIKEDFLAANPSFGEQGFVVLCTRNGRYLEEVHACLTKDLEGRACNREEQGEACRSDQVVMRPVR